MKINEVFKLPLYLDSDVVRDNNNDWIVNMDSTHEDDAIVTAINHHDELVEALKENNNMLTSFTEHGFVRELINRNFELIDKIEGK